MKLVVYEVNVSKTRTGKSVSIDVEKTNTVLELRQEMGKLLKVRVNNLIVFLEDEFLDAEITLEAYGIDESSTITYETKLCGPVPVNRDWTSSGYVKRRLGVEITKEKPSVVTMDI